MERLWKSHGKTRPSPSTSHQVARSGTGREKTPRRGIRTFIGCLLHVHQSWTTHFIILFVLFHLSSWINFHPAISLKPALSVCHFTVSKILKAWFAFNEEKMDENCIRGCKVTSLARLHISSTFPIPSTMWMPANGNHAYSLLIPCI